MTRRHHTGLRALVVTLAVPLALSIAAGTANADPGKGNGHSAVAPGQLNKTDATATTSSTATDSNAAPGSSDHSAGNASTTGDVSSPQPPSTADQNNTGANNTSASNPYASTRDGSPSLNGNGNGNATGKPCAGCVGKADNKNPKGQAPGGSDRNAGYECDRNHGIGRSNPAHTGCKSTPPPPPPTCEQTNSCTKQTCMDTGTCPAQCDASKQDCAPKPDCKTTGTCPSTNPCDASTQDCSQQPPCDDTQENCTTPPPVPPTVPPTHVKAVHHSRVPPTEVPQVQQLPFTGSNATQLLVVAVLTLLAGAGLLLAARRPTRTYH